MNQARGETEIEIGGVHHRLCLTLGALADLETAFGCASLTELQTRLRQLSAHEMKRVLEILLVGDAAKAPLNDVSPGEAARAIGEAFHAALG